VVRRLVVIVSLLTTATATTVISTLPGARPAFALGNDYPWANEDGLGTNPSTYTWTNAVGSPLSPLRFAYRNCTDYAAWEINEELGVTSSAGPYKFTWSNIESAGHGDAVYWEQGAIDHYGASSVNEIPTAGSIAWWGKEAAHGLGHVAIVASVSNSGSTIVIDEYNALVVGGYDSQTLTYNPISRKASSNGTTWPDAFIHIPGTSIPPAPLSITTTSLSAATVNQPYSVTLNATGGTPPYTWSALPGTLPAPLALGSATGVIAGIPTSARQSRISIIVKDAVGRTAALGYTLTAMSPDGMFLFPPGVMHQVNDVSLDSLVSAAEKKPQGARRPLALPAGNTLLISDAKPEILFLGAEYCPWCAAERWPLVMALAKFGSFGDLMGAISPASYSDPQTPTFSFYGSTYTSMYLSFSAVEQETNTGLPLQTPTAAQEALLTKWEVVPYIPAADKGSNPIPFVYMAGRYLLVGTQYDAGHISNWEMTAAASYLTASNNTTSLAAEAAAGYLVGDICSLTHNQPESVCSAVPPSLKR
jgi:surface antigen